MSITEDLRNVSEAALGKLAAQFGDLPRPLLAAIGAGDAAVERLVRLRDQLGERWNEERDSAAAGAEEAGAEDRGGDIDRDDVDASEDRDASSRLADATRRAQHIAEDVARRLSDAMGEMPDMAQRMIADLPAKAQEVANSLSRENLKDTVESYTRRVADVYRELADRGGERLHEAADKNKADAAAKERAQETAAPAKAAAKTAPAQAASPAPSEPVTSEPAERKPATTKPGISKPTAHRSGTARPAAPRPVRRKPTDGDAAD
jgi:hypothetical protein